MPKKYYRIKLTENIEIHVYFETINGILINFVVKLVLELNNNYYEIIRFDTAHGCPHKDILDKNGDVIRKVWYDSFDYKQALRVAIKDLKDNYDLYIERFKKWIKK